MVDTPASSSEKTPLETIKDSENISDSEVTIAVGSERVASSGEQWNMSRTESCVPKIVIIDNYGGEHSPSDSPNAKDDRGTKKERRDGKKYRRKDGDTRARSGGGGGRVVPAEGQRRQGDDLGTNGAEATISSEPRLRGNGRTKSSLAEATEASSVKCSSTSERETAMERAHLSPAYSSDEWELDSVVGSSDTDDDHTDSSDDDDPKSQVDRLIERGTLMYIEGENSALSSEDESDDDYDSESDITDVSPLVSATASPLGLSPVLPRRTIPTSPLALHDNRELSFGYDERQSPFNWDHATPPDERPPSFRRRGSDPGEGEEEEEEEEEENGSSNMDLLLQAVIELENQNRRQAQKEEDDRQYNLNDDHQLAVAAPLAQPPASSGLPPHHHNLHQQEQMFIHPIRDNPHHIHLRRTNSNNTNNNNNNTNRRKNMSFTNEEVRKIDRDNKILLKKIMAAHTRPHHHPGHAPSRPHHHYRGSGSPANRRREEKIRRENLILLKKIQEAKPSKEVVSPLGGATMDPILSPVGVAATRGGLRSPTNSCGAFMRSMGQPPHVNVPPPRKETAL